MHQEKNNGTYRRIQVSAYVVCASLRPRVASSAIISSAKSFVRYFVSVSQLFD